ncbi:hypothetical protein SAMN02982918_3645 [Saccharomonospora viridis]|uniref:Uncharacterized protein n=1 Tax=Saccharomonospora viridis (strain ATCC 15386 / DSM 43017 / JCM 3036 / CCUG 5913 / NBRC 12207 / NCIMB 9602 / P101) TaxID=471857 RepID=C7MZA2_SACVD|nr:hypothetical protein Svir_24750 [Saccharomonospora viridis DSM 43017]SFP85755.1 hypothetical protein SAMN02982918_3645 [Saccharomonospora viridis]
MAGRDLFVTPLQESVHRRLDEITHSVYTTSPEIQDELDNLSVTLLAGALRTVLAEHRPDASGHCTLCHGRRNPFTRKRGPLPCRAYLAAQVALVPDEPGEISPDDSTRSRARERMYYFLR